MSESILHKALVQYFNDGCKPNTGDVGVECEHFIVYAENLKAVSFYGENGVEQLLREFADCLGVSDEMRNYSEGYLVGFRADLYLVSLEPGAQVEISIDKSNDIGKIEEIYNSFYSKLTVITEKYGYLIVNAGYQPASRVEDVQLIPKKRYELMDKHFKCTGNSGINMMRGTGAVHVSVDYEDEQDFVLKYRLANLLVPILSLMTENIAVFEGEELELSDGYLKRLSVWKDVDPARCGTVPNVFDDDFGFDAYANYIMGLKPLFLPTVHGGIFAVGSDVTANELFTAGMDDFVEFDLEEIVLHLLSMTFVDIRLKQYIEIRCADSMPIEMTIPFVEMIQRLFLDKERVANLYWELTNGREDLLKAKNDAIEQTIKFGYDAVVYGKDIKYWICKLNKSVFFESDGCFEGIVS